jgi:hypothetical protein
MDPFYRKVQQIRWHGFPADFSCEALAKQEGEKPWFFVILGPGGLLTLA